MTSVEFLIDQKIFISKLSFRNLKKNGYTSASTYHRTKLKPLLGIIIVFVRKPCPAFWMLKKVSIYTGIGIMASDIFAHCKYCTIVAQWVDYTFFIYYFGSVHLHNILNINSHTIVSVCHICQIHTRHIYMYIYFGHSSNLIYIQCTPENETTTVS